MKKGLKTFQQVYDIACNMANLALDLAQNLSFRYEIAEDNTVREEDVHMAYGLSGGGRKYPLDILPAIHDLAKVLGYTREDYIEGADRRRGRGNVYIYIAGKGSINCDTDDLLGVRENKDAST